MSVAGLKKQFYKASQMVSEKVGGAEGTKLDEDFKDLERKADITSKAIVEVLARTSEYLQPNPASRAKLSMLNTMSKIRGQVKSPGYPQAEGVLGECMSRYGLEMGDETNFGGALVEMGESMKRLAEVKDSLDIDVKQNFIDPFQTIVDKDLRDIQHQLKKVEGRRLDYDYKKKRQGKIPDDELRASLEKFHESKEAAEISMHNLLETDVMSTIRSQPIPYGLEREKHIEMIFTAFHTRWRSMDPQDLTTTSHPTQGSLCDDLLPTFQPASLGSNRHKGEQWVTEALPPSLAALRTVSQIHITAIPELQGPQCISRRIYSVAEETRQLFLAVEESSGVCMECCGPARACSLQGFDQDRQKVFIFERPLRADMCCLGCCLMEMRAYTAQRELIGTVHQRWSMFTPYFEVCDAADSPLLRIQGSCCPIRCLSDQEFQVVSMIGEHSGTVWKKWPGYNKSCNMDHEYFGLDVSKNMNVNAKVLLLAGTFLLNHMFFEMS